MSIKAKIELVFDVYIKLKLFREQRDEIDHLKTQLKDAIYAYGWTLSDHDCDEEKIILLMNKLVEGLRIMWKLKTIFKRGQYTMDCNELELWEEADKDIRKLPNEIKKILISLVKRDIKLEQSIDELEKRHPTV